MKKIVDINNLILESKYRIKQKHEEFVKIKQTSLKNNQPNEKYFSDLESYVQLYHQKCSLISHGLGFYSDFTTRINQLGQRINDYILARDLEKNDLIKIFTGQKIAPGNYHSNPLINPNTNTITNMDYQFTYQHYNYNNQYPSKK